MDKTSFEDNELHFIIQVGEIIKAHRGGPLDSDFRPLGAEKAGESMVSQQIYPLNLIGEYENLLQ